MKQPARANERQIILALLEDRICFDNLEGRGCEHPACYELLDLHRHIESGGHLVK